MIEMIVVLVVIGLVLGLITARRAPMNPLLELRGAADRLAQSLRVARARAIASDREVNVVLDAPRHRFAVESGQAQLLPADLALSLATAAGETPAGGVGRIGFASDGSSTGGRITLERNGRKLQVGVEWLTGRIWVHDAQ